jgi:hypothetical protein
VIIEVGVEVEEEACQLRRYPICQLERKSEIHDMCLSTSLLMNSEMLIFSLVLVPGTKSGKTNTVSFHVCVIDGHRRVPGVISAVDSVTTP